MADWVALRAAVYTAGQEIASAHDQPGSVLLVVTGQNLADSNCFRNRVVLNVSVIRELQRLAGHQNPASLMWIAQSLLFCVTDIRMDQATQTHEMMDTHFFSPSYQLLCAWLCKASRKQHQLSWCCH